MSKVLMVSRSIPLHPGQGGMARAAWDLATALHRGGVRIEVVTTPVPGRAPSFVSEGIRVHTISGAAPGRYSLRWWAGTALSQHLAGTSAVLSVSSGATTMVWLRRGPRYVFQLHGTSAQELKAVLLLRPQLWWLRAVRLAYWCIAESITLRRPHTVVAVSEQVSDSLQRWPYRCAWKRTRLLRIPNPVDADRFSGAIELRHSARIELGLRPLDLVAITVSRLTRQKGVDRCLDALARIPDGVKLLAVGTGPEEEALKQQAQRLGVIDRVTFTGELDREQLRRALAAADVFIFPVRAFSREGLPLSVLEALAAGLRVIVPRGSTWPADIRQSLDAVALDQPQALADAIAADGTQTSDRVSRLPTSYGLASVSTAYRSLLLDREGADVGPR